MSPSPFALKSVLAAFALLALSGCGQPQIKDDEKKLATLPVATQVALVLEPAAFALALAAVFWASHGMPFFGSANSKKEDES